MNTQHTFRSVRTLLIVASVVGSLTTACKKSSSDPDVDPRDQYVGTYNGGDRGYQSIITIGSIPLNAEYGAASIIVTKGSGSKEIYIEAPQQSLKVTAELNGSDFTVIDKSSSQIFIPPNNTYTGSYQATGVFGVDQATGKNSVALRATTQTLEKGTSISRSELFTGSRN